MQVTHVQQADSNEMFAPDAFAASLGREVPMALPDGSTTTATLLGATVLPGGTAVEMTFEVPDSVRHLFV